MAPKLTRRLSQLAVLHTFPKLLEDPRLTRPEKLDTIIKNLEEYRIETKKRIIQQALLEKNSAESHPPADTTQSPSSTTSHFRESNLIASDLRTRWDPSAAKPTVKPTATRSTSSPPLSGPANLAAKTIARLDAYDKQSARTLDKFYKSRERLRRESGQGSGGSGQATPVVENAAGDPRLAGRSGNVDASRDPRLRRA